jgi:nicotinamide-nucleotide amidase
MTETMSASRQSSTPAGPADATASGHVEFTRVDEHLVRLAGRVLGLAQEQQLSIVTAESCTGGLVAAVLSEAPGAGTHLQGGFVAYTKTQKTLVLDVPAELLKTKGAVCREVAHAMAEGALRHSTADVAVAITGVAGPTEDEDGNPVGLMHFAVLRRGALPLQVERRFGEIGSGAIRYQALAEAMALLTRALSFDGR